MSTTRQLVAKALIFFRWLLTVKSFCFVVHYLFAKQLDLFVYLDFFFFILKKYIYITIYITILIYSGL